MIGIQSYVYLLKDSVMMVMVDDNGKEVTGKMQAH